MTSGVLRSLNPDRSLIIVKVDDRAAEVALRVRGSDRSAMATMPAGQRISFEFACNRHGDVFAIDVLPIPTFSRVRKWGGAKGRYPNDLLEPGHRGSATEAHLEELLAAPIVQKLMQRDGVDPQAVRSLVSTVARAAVKAS
jgi:hypothetical protein